MSESREQLSREKECAFLEGVRRRCPDHLSVLEALGDLYTKLGRLEDGLAIDESLTAKAPDNAMYQYNLACSLSLLGRPEEAISTLEAAVRLGYSDWEWMIKDADLKPLRKLPAFASLVARLREQYPPL